MGFSVTINYLYSLLSLFDRARVQFRKAQLTAKRSAEVAKRKERELLFANIQEGTESSTSGYGRRKGQEKLSQEELLLNASSDVTAALRRTHNLMSSELERSQFARETLGVFHPTFTEIYVTDDLAQRIRQRPSIRSLNPTPTLIICFPHPALLYRLSYIPKSLTRGT